MKECAKMSAGIAENSGALNNTTRKQMKNTKNVNKAIIFTSKFRLYRKNCIFKAFKVILLLSPSTQLSLLKRIVLKFF